MDFSIRDLAAERREQEQKIAPVAGSNRRSCAGAGYQTTISLQRSSGTGNANTLNSKAVAQEEERVKKRERGMSRGRKAPTICGSIP
jgi:hypothetical protein